MSTDKQRTRISETLYFLGKGIWKGVPIIGPIVEETFYNQFEESLRGQIDEELAQKTDEELEAISSLLQGLPKLEDLKSLEQRMGELSEKQSSDVQRILLTAFTDGISRVCEDVCEIDHKLDSISSVLMEVLKSSLKEEQVSSIIDSLMNKRSAWVKRLSPSQQSLLGHIGKEYVEVEILRGSVSNAIGDVPYREFRFRLHELEWLELVERRRSKNGDWEYKLAAGISGSK